VTLSDDDGLMKVTILIKNLQTEKNGIKVILKRNFHLNDDQGVDIIAC